MAGSRPGRRQPLSDRPWRWLWKERPQAQKLTLAVWLSVVPVFMTTSTLALYNARQDVEGRVRQQLMWDAQQAGSWLTYWDEQHMHQLELLAWHKDIRSFDSRQASDLMNRVRDYFPHHSYALINRKTGTIARTGPLFQPWHPQQLKELQSDKTSPYAKALKGVSSTAPLLPPFVREPCVSSSTPVYNVGDKTQTTPIGVLSSCLTLQSLGFSTGIDRMIRDVSAGKQELQLMNIDHGKRRGYALLLVFRQGQLIELGLNNGSHSKGADKDHYMSVKQVESSNWAPLIRMAKSSKAGASVDHINIGGIDYIAGIDNSSPGRSVLMVLDSQSAFSTVNNFFILMWLGIIAALAVSTLVMQQITKELAKPFDIVGQVLEQMSQGIFGSPLPQPESDIGRLFGYINDASSQLQIYLEETRKHSATDAQLKEARRIQADFLVKNLPRNEHVEIAALFQPAYEIGADWYDGFQLNDTSFIVVADVCDKGIPSALYMSVFRSLLRLSLMNEWQRGGDAHETLHKAIRSVNEYMAANHGESAMFATMYAGAYNQQTNILSYIVAGHEAPMVLAGHQLSTLPLGGPAVGIFPEAVFKVGSCHLQPGSIILAFSDGLPDARNANGEVFGPLWIAQILRERCSADWTAAALVERLGQAANTFMQGTEQFDDLTLLSLKIGPTDQRGPD